MPVEVDLGALFGIGARESVDVGFHPQVPGDLAERFGYDNAKGVGVT